LDENNGIIRKVAYGLSRKYVAGSTTSSMLKTVREINDRGWHATVTLLNDNVTEISKARYNANAYSQVARELTRLRLHSDISVRPSQLGCNIDFAAFTANLEQLGKLVNGGGTRVWLEHEDGVDQQRLVGLYGRLKKEYSLGIEIRPGTGSSDMAVSIEAGDSVRVCYDNRFEHKDSPKLYSGLVDDLSARKAKVILSSNDTKWMRSIVRGHEAYKRSLMFEIPLGYSVSKLNGLAKGRNTLSLYVPYGKDWAPYIVNRLAEGKMRSIAARLLGKINDEIDGRRTKDGK
jgi:proline dehydrogenase